MNTNSVVRVDPTLKPSATRLIEQVSLWDLNRRPECPPEACRGRGNCPGLCANRESGADAELNQHFIASY